MLYLDDGVNVDASWVNHIAVSYDGTNWSTINKANLNVHSRWLNLSTGPVRHPFLNKSAHGLISLTVGSDDTQILTFDPNDVTNRPTWQGGTVVELQAAVAEITGWLN